MKFGSLALLAVIFLGVHFSGVPAQAQQIDLYDPDLQSGFPVQIYLFPMPHNAGPGINTLIANLDADSALEIVISGRDEGPAYAWKPDGALVTGWPPDDNAGEAYPAAGNLINSSDTLEIVTNYFLGETNAYDPSGEPMPGWPIFYPRYNAIPPSLADVDGDGYEEIFVAQSSSNIIEGFKFDGSALPGWPVQEMVGQYFHTPAIADLDKDGDLEIINASGSASMMGGILFAFHHDGTRVNGFPANFFAIYNDYPVVGDVDGDGELEIVVLGMGSEYIFKILIFSAAGVLERSIPILGQNFYGDLAVLADLDDDGIPEIIIQTNEYINAFHGNGTAFPGWPVFLGDSYWMGNSAPVVGDVDGDQLPDLVVTVQVAGSATKGEVRVYNRNGILHMGFPKQIEIGSGAVPAIADIDLDGRNEIIISGAISGTQGFIDQLWVYDLGGPAHGEIEWGQFAGGPEHRGLYPVPPPPTTPVTPPSGEQVFLPFVSKAGLQITSGIHGRLITASSGVGNMDLELNLFSGGTWSTIQHTSTTANGEFAFSAVPDLGSNQKYRVHYKNSGSDPGLVSEWTSREISTYWEGSLAGVSDFDASNLHLQTPEDGASVSLPATFFWQPRNSPVSEMFSLLIYDPVDRDPLFQSRPYLNAIGFQMNYLPERINYDTPYVWSIWIVGPDGALGVPIETRAITFLQTSSQLSASESTIAVTPIYK